MTERKKNPIILLVETSISGGKGLTFSSMDEAAAYAKTAFENDDVKYFTAVRSFGELRPQVTQSVTVKRVPYVD